MAALAVAAVGVVAVSLVSVDILGPAGGGRPGPSPATETPSVAPTIPVAPVAVPPAGNAVAAETPSTAQTAWFGVVVPILLAAAAAALGWLLLRWRRRRTRPPRETLDSREIDREIRREDRRFSLAAGALVVLTGISVLYVGNATFGSPGDYLAIALWGAAVGEGLQLARRLWPSLPTSASS